MVIETFDGYKDETVFGVAFSPDGKVLAAGSGRIDIKGRVRLWEVATRKELPELRGVRDCVRALAFSPDGKTLAAACHDKRVILWDVATWKVSRVLETSHSVRAVVFSGDSKHLAFAAYNQISIYDPVAGKVLRRIDSSGGLISALAFTPDGTTLFGTGWDNTIRRWDIATGEAIHAAPGHETTVTSLRYSPDGSILASFSYNSELHLWDARTGKPLHRLRLWPEGGSEVDEQRRHDWPVVFSPDGKTVYARCQNEGEFVQGWDVATGKKQFSAFQKPHFFHFFDLSPDGRTLVVPSNDRICFWSAEGKKELPAIEAPPPGQRNSSQTLYLPDGQTLLCARMVEILLVDARDGSVLGQLEAKKPKKPALPSGQLHRLILSPDNRLLAAVDLAWTGEEGNAVFVWEVATGKILSPFAVAADKGKGTDALHDGAVCAVAFSPDGRVLATAGLVDRTVRLWDVRTGKHLRCLKGHAGGVTSVDFHPDGKTLASGSTDTTILLWDVSRFYPPPADVPAPEKLAALWDDLAAADPKAAFQTADVLAAAGDKTVTLLAARLKPVPAPDAGTIRQLLDDLEDRSFAVREKATRELAQLGPVVEADLRRKLKDKPSPDLERRLKALLENVRPWIRDPDTLRAVRAVAVLERIGTADAAALLKKLAAGAEAAPLTREAQAAADRLRRLSPR